MELSELCRRLADKHFPFSVKTFYENFPLAVSQNVFIPLAALQISSYDEHSEFDRYELRNAWVDRTQTTVSRRQPENDKKRETRLLLYIKQVFSIFQFLKTKNNF